MSAASCGTRVARIGFACDAMDCRINRQIYSRVDNEIACVDFATTDRAEIVPLWRHAFRLCAGIEKILGRSYEDTLPNGIA
ncbi:hypothetical protein [Bradyrhizobium cytisi]|uniref:Uncharacterized protein n=1 Tax=Bradyrhizobium cytisi TaxID=515489 RepID=A0A5S4W2Y2_9BRAD|nr:hypothetical protein [Bradyrhizobium cytisi]TYL75887.1 hypothetical protein FXB38_32240 [Bradyrhizobium cytisi]